MQKNGMATASLVLGIASIILSFFFGGGFIIGLLGITFAFLSRRPHMNKSALIGLMLSTIGTFLSAIILICFFEFISSPDFEDNMNKYLEEFTKDLEISPDNYFGPDDYFDNFGFGYNDDYYEGGRKL